MSLIRTMAGIAGATAAPPTGFTFGFVFRTTAHSTLENTDVHIGAGWPAYADDPANEVTNGNGETVRAGWTADAVTNQEPLNYSPEPEGRFVGATRIDTYSSTPAHRFGWKTKLPAGTYDIAISALHSNQNRTAAIEVIVDDSLVEKVGVGITTSGSRHDFAGNVYAVNQGGADAWNAAEPTSRYRVTVVDTVELVNTIEEVNSAFPGWASIRFYPV